MKKVRILILMLYFLKKNKEKDQEISLFYTCVPKILMIYSFWYIKCDRLNLVIMGHFLPFYHPSPKKPKKSEFWKNEKHCWRYHFIHVYQKPQSYGMVPGIWSETDTFFCHFGPVFSLLPPLQPRKSKFWKNEKNI